MTRALSQRGRSSAGLRRSLLDALGAYFARSNLPLTMLLFLLPMIILYEVGTRLYASDAINQTETRVLAFTLMRRFMAAFGATGQHLPGLAVFGILIVWHIARRDRWELQVGTAMGMCVESALMALPVLAIGKVLGYCMPLAGLSGGAWRSGVVLALGAGIYEELIFRLAAFTLLNIALLDLLRVDKRAAYVFMVASTSLLFAAYHYWSPQSSAFLLREFLFRTAAGVYFGVLFMTRGFGVTSGCHAAYDIYYFLFAALAGR